MTTNKVTYATEIVGSDVPHVDADTYLARCDGVEEATTRFGDAFKTHWVLVEADDFELIQMTSTATTSGSNFGRIVRALTGPVPRDSLMQVDRRMDSRLRHQ